MEHQAKQSKTPSHTVLKSLGSKVRPLAHNPFYGEAPQSYSPAQMQMPEKKVEKDERMQMKKGEGAQGGGNSGGTATHLPEGLKNKMEMAFGADFSDVQITRDSSKAANLGALAYTQGNQVHFAPGQFKPNDHHGEELIGHELAHVVQQREGRVATEGEVGGMPVNMNRSLEREADDAGAKASRGEKVGNHTALGNGGPAFQAKGIGQFALPAILAALGAAEWIAIGAIGYTLAKDAVAATSGDVNYKFDEMEGVLLPGGGTDVAAHKTANPGALAYEAEHKLAIYVENLLGNRLLGAKFAITFIYDTAGAIGNISMRIISVYDWAGYGGTLDINLTPRSLARGNATIRLTANLTSDNSIVIPESSGGIEFILRGGDGDLSVSHNPADRVRYEIG